jgi:hypothetical protein
MINLDLNFVKDIAITFMFLVLMGTAAWDKWKVLQTPGWFIQQFEKTVLPNMPGGIPFLYWVIATLEAALFIAFAVSLFVPGLIQVALVGSLFLFGILCFGLRLIGEFQGSANMFVYFGATLISLYMVG